MPNWVTNVVHALKDDVDFAEFTDEEGNFTFEKIVPMPDDIFRGNLGQEERAKYGEKNWYDWSMEHWGTKWDASESNVQGNTVYFETAWTCPVDVLKELGKKVGGLLVFYADEDTGSNCGGFLVKSDGHIIELDDRTIMAVAIQGDDLYDHDIIERFLWELECE
jgi:hypothetical protein